MQSVVAMKSTNIYIPTVRRIIRELGEQYTANYIKLQLISLNVMLNLARPMSEAMIEQTAPLIVRHLQEEVTDVSIADLRIIFDRAKTGYYGSFYGGIGCADIIKWIDDYVCNDLSEALEEYYRREKNEREGGCHARTSGQSGVERLKNHEAMAMYYQNKIAKETGENNAENNQEK